MSKEAMTEVLEAIEEVAKHIGRFDPPMQPNYLVLSLGNQIDTLRRLISEQEQPINEVVVNADYREMWKQQVEMNQQLTAALSAQPAKQEQGEPVAHLWQHSQTGRTRIVMPGGIITADASWFVVGPLVLGNTTPQQRKPLTDEQIRDLMRVLGWTGESPSDMEFARIIEAAHGIKEGT
jgi:hypothetical protein